MHPFHRVPPWKRLIKPLPRPSGRGRAPMVALAVACLILGLSASIASVQPALSQAQKSFLWKVQSSRSTVYLLGSIHFLKKEVYPLSQAIESAYESSDTLVVEADINEIGNLDLNKLANSAFYTMEDHLEKHVSPETYDLIKRESKALGMPLELVGMQKPWILALSFQASELMRLGYDPQQGVDYHFLARAKGKKRILELESLEEQLDFLSGFSEKDQEQFLLYTLKTLSSLGSQVQNVVRAWTSGDAQAMESILSEAALRDARIAPIFRKLLDERNVKMASRIEGYLDSNESYFVIVGAGHLVGKRGIVELIRSKGYPVEQL